MKNVTFRVPEETKQEMKELSLNWSEYLRESVREALDQEWKREIHQTPPLSNELSLLASRSFALRTFPRPPSPHPPFMFRPFAPRTLAPHPRSVFGYFLLAFGAIIVYPLLNAMFFRGDCT